MGRQAVAPAGAPEDPERLRDWQARLTAAFFDPEQRARIIEEIRDGVAQSASGLGEEERRRRQEQVVAELVLAALRDASPSPPGASREGTSLGGAALVRTVTRDYPYPIALAYRTLQEEIQPASAFGCLLDAFESLVHYLAMVAVSAYLRAGSSHPHCSRLLLDRFIKGRWSPGDLFALLRDTVRLAGDCGGRLPYRELPAYLFTAQGRPTASCRVLEAFVELRNRVWAHAAGRSGGHFAALLPPNVERLDHELAQMTWLTEWELIRPVRIEEETGRVREADLLMGDLRLSQEPYNLQIRPDDLHRSGGDVRAERTLLLVAPDRGRYLPLFPLSLFAFRVHSEHLYLLQNLEWQHSPTRQLRRACYVTYDWRRRETYEEQYGDWAVRSLEAHVGRLAAGRPGGEGEADPAAPAGDPDLRLSQVRAEQDFHLRTFAGREEILQHLEDWMGRREEGSYLLLKGPPGQGKSALMAEVARRATERHGCLLHMIRSHRDPLRFLPSLISQAARQLAVSFGRDAYGGGVDDLRDSLLRALEALQERHGRAVLILDALDELDPEWEPLPFLPRALPPGIGILLTCRPRVSLVQSVTGRLRPLEVVDLAPLSREDLLPFLQRHLRQDLLHGLESGVDWDALLRRVQGNPLLLQRALERVAAAADQARRAGGPLRVEVGSFPGTLEDLFGQIYSDIAERRGGQPTSPEGARRAGLLQILCLAREPLDVEQLAELMAVRQAPLPFAHCRDLLVQMSEYLLETGAGFKPWHEGLVDHVKERELGASGCREIEELFCRWLDVAPDRLSHYGLRHRGRHLQAAGWLDDLVALLADRGFVEARCRTDMVFELAADLAAVDEARKPLEPMMDALVEGLAGQLSERVRQQLRSALNQYFGPYDAWPQALRRRLEGSDRLGVMVFLADTHDMEERPDRAAALFERMVARTGRSGGLAGLVEELGQGADEEAYATGCVRLASVYDHQSRWHEALALLEGLASRLEARQRIGRHYWWAHYHRGILLRKLGRDEEAEQTLEGVWGARAGLGLTTSALHHLGVLDIKRGNLERAEQRFRSCLWRRGGERYDHRRAYEHRRLGQVHALAGRWDEARAAFEEALRISQACGNQRYVHLVQDDRRAYLALLPALRKAAGGPVGLASLTAGAALDEAGLRQSFRLLAEQNLGYLDLVDEATGEATGRVADWDRVHREGWWHSSVTVLAVDAQGFLALQRRQELDSRGRWDVSVAGHVEVGEADVAAAARETREELGVAAAPERLVRLGGRREFRKAGSPDEEGDRHEDPVSFRYRTGKRNRERVSVFLLLLEEGEKERVAASVFEWAAAREAARRAAEQPESFASSFKQLFGHPETRQRVLEAIERTVSARR